MKHLHIEITKEDTKPGLLNGECSTKQLVDISILRLLGVELIARTSPEELLPLLQEAFVLLANAGNGAAARATIEAIYELVVTLNKKNSIDTKLSYEELGRRRRSEEQTFFHWFEPVYWSLPLYVPDVWETSLRGSGVNYRDPLETLKTWAVSKASDLWNPQHNPDDALADRAFGFLCDSFDPKRFFERAKEVTDSFKRSRLYNSLNGPLKVQEKDSDFVLQVLGTDLKYMSLPSLCLWFERAKAGSVPQPIIKLFAHTYVDRSSDVTLPRQ